MSRENLHVKIEAELKEKLFELASNDRRTVTDFVVMMIEDRVKEQEVNKKQ